MMRVSEPFCQSVQADRTRFGNATQFIYFSDINFHVRRQICFDSLCECLNYSNASCFFSTLGRRLVNCCISETMVSSLFECGHLCLTHGCQSFNYGQMENLSRQLYRCELNNCTKDDHLLSVDPKFDFYELIKEVAESHFTF